MYYIKVYTEKLKKKKVFLIISYAYYGAYKYGNLSVGFSNFLMVNKTTKTL